MLRAVHRGLRANSVDVNEDKRVVTVGLFASAPVIPIVAGAPANHALASARAVVFARGRRKVVDALVEVDSARLHREGGLVFYVEAGVLSARIELHPDGRPDVAGGQLRDLVVELRLVSLDDFVNSSLANLGVVSKIFPLLVGNRHFESVHFNPPVN
jgi:hypothetical protein